VADAQQRAGRCFSIITEQSGAFEVAVQGLGDIERRSGPRELAEKLAALQQILDQLLMLRVARQVTLDLGDTGRIKVPFDVLAELCLDVFGVSHGTHFRLPIVDCRFLYLPNWQLKIGNQQ
jgi:hypothetical protein